MRSNQSGTPIIALLCSGLDSVSRGYETHMRVLFERLADDPAIPLEARLFKGSGVSSAGETALRTPRRDGRVCRFLSQFRGDGLYWEYSLFALCFVIRCALLRERIFTIACIEPMVAKTLMRLRWLLPGHPRITFTHGVWMDPADYWWFADCIHEVNVENHGRMAEYQRVTGIRRELAIIPHFIDNGSNSADQEPVQPRQPSTRPGRVVLTVGVIDSDHKRTDHVIREVAMLGTEWTLLACGAPKGTDGQRVIALGRELLGERFRHMFLPRDRVAEVYRSADIFVLGSLNEGFGLVLLEAMRAGLPVVAHDRPLFRWILGDDSPCIPMDHPGALAAKLRELADDPEACRQIGIRNRARFLQHFTWWSVRDDYVRMLLGPSAQRTRRSR
jgi:1,2-diacylglycerol 3-alpha-glucosyltransferase